MAVTVLAYSIWFWASCQASASITTSAGFPFTVRTEGRPVCFRWDMRRVVSRLNSVRVRMSLVMSIAFSGFSHSIQCEYNAFEMLGATDRSAGSRKT